MKGKLQNLHKNLFCFEEISNVACATFSVSFLIVSLSLLHSDSIKMSVEGSFSAENAQADSSLDRYSHSSGLKFNLLLRNILSEFSHSCLKL